MTEYGFEIKLKVVQDYLDGKGGYRYLAKKYGVKNADQVRSWINSYQQFGEEGLFRKHYDNTYSVQFKMDAIGYIKRVSCPIVKLPIDSV